MTLRERIADWISGGALTWRKNGWDRSAAINAQHCEDLRGAHSDLSFARSALMAEASTSNSRRGALRAIAAMETPHANATVRRMAQAAREALK